MRVSIAHQSHTVTYVVLGIIFLLLTGVAMVSFLSAHEEQQAQEKAAQLSSELAAAGLRAPATDRIAQVLGDDGGAVCADPDDALRRGVLYGMLTNGAAGPGQRPVIVDNNAMRGQLAIMKVYCPQYLERFQEVVDDLKTASVAG
jgi:Tfp pilus assembly protein FimT